MPGRILALKMVAHVGLVPFAGTFPAKQSRKSMPMVLVAEMWQIAILPFAFHPLSAVFAPLFPSFVPDRPDDHRHPPCVPATGPSRHSRHACCFDPLNSRWSGSRA